MKREPEDLLESSPYHGSMVHGAGYTKLIFSYARLIYVCRNTAAAIIAAAFCVQKLGKEHIGKVSIQKRLFTAIALIMTLLLAGCSAIGSNGHRGSLDVDYIANGDEGEDRLNQLKGLAAENDTPEPDDKLRTPAPVDSGDDEDTASVGRAQAEARDNEITSEAVQAEQTAAPVSSKEPEANTCTITIRCDTAVAKGMHLEKKWQGIVPASGEILKTTTMTFEQGDTVFDVLCAVRDKYKLHMEYSGAKGNEYIEGINNFYEFDGRPLERMDVLRK